MKGWFKALVLVTLCKQYSGFQSVSGPHGLTRRVQQSSLHAKTSPSGDFELQELKAQIESMKLQGIPSRSLPPTKRFELEAYARSVVQNKSSPVPLNQVSDNLPSTKWRLVFSTENSALSDLPSDASIHLSFLEENNVDYSLIFGEKTMGLNSITAKSKWRADESNFPGLVSMKYDKIVCDAFGFQNVGIGLFGLLKGRTSYIQTAYFDDELWIEAGSAADGSGKFVSVYTKEKSS